jgi:hypothetical protein
MTEKKNIIPLGAGPPTTLVSLLALNRNLVSTCSKLVKIFNWLGPLFEKSDFFLDIYIIYLLVIINVSENSSVNCHT